MERRWLVLILLFIVRTTIGIQYQSIASTSAFLVKDLGINNTQLGTLIGLYQAAGILLAFPGGVLGRRYGEKKIASLGLLLMTLSGALMAISGSILGITIGRFLCGIGAGLLGTVLTTMCMDWFTGKEIVASMAIFVSSWPFGLSIGLVLLSIVAQSTSWQMSFYLVSALSIASLLLVQLYKPAGPEAKLQSEGFKLSFNKIDFSLLFLAGGVWALFNVGFVIVPSFGPGYLRSLGFSLVDASYLASVVTWVVTPALMIGGYFSGKIGRPNLIMISSFLGIAIVMVLLPYMSSFLLPFLVLGLLFGAPAGLIMALPSEVLKRENRGPGMGVFQTVATAGQTFLPVVAGYLQDATGNNGVSLTYGGACLALAVVFLLAFRVIQSRAKEVALSNFA